MAYHRLQILCLLPQLWESSPKMLSGFLLILKIELCFSTNPCNVEFSEIAIYFEINKWIHHLWNKAKDSYENVLSLALHAMFIALTLMIGKLFFLRVCISCSTFKFAASLIESLCNIIVFWPKSEVWIVPLSLTNSHSI